jgi:hypothetical protein
LTAAIAAFAATDAGPAGMPSLPKRVAAIWAPSAVLRGEETHEVLPLVECRASAEDSTVAVDSMAGVVTDSALLD